MTCSNRQVTLDKHQSGQTTRSQHTNSDLVKQKSHTTQTMTWSNKTITLHKQWLCQTKGYTSQTTTWSSQQVTNNMKQNIRNSLQWMTNYNLNRTLTNKVWFSRHKTQNEKDTGVKLDNKSLLAFLWRRMWEKFAEDILCYEIKTLHFNVSFFAWMVTRWLKDLSVFVKNCLKR